jgi:putative chitinase
MDFDLTLEQFSQMVPNCKNPESWLPPLIDVLPQYDITTEMRFAAFVAQTAHESGEFNILKENLNYSVDGLLRIFRKYFDAGLANQYARKPEKIANRVYANRMGNGNEQSGDGFKYCGRGLIQLTGKNNYAACSQDLYGDSTLLDDPDQLLYPENAVEAACWFWQKNGLNVYADKQDMKMITQRINGGQNGYDERVAIYNRVLDVLGV